MASTWDVPVLFFDTPEVIKINLPKVIQNFNCPLVKKLASLQRRKNWKRGLFGHFQHPFCRKTPKKWKGDPLGIFFPKMSHNTEKNWKGDAVVSPGIVCYAEKKENPFWPICPSISLMICDKFLWWFATEWMKNVKVSPLAHQFGPTFGFFGCCRKYFDILKSFCCFWALDMAPTWAVPGLFELYMHTCMNFLFWNFPKLFFVKQLRSEKVPILFSKCVFADYTKKLLCQCASLVTLDTIARNDPNQ